MAVLQRINGKTEIYARGKEEIYTLVVKGDCEIHYHLQDGDYRFLIVHEEGSPLRLKETGIIQQARVTITYFDVNDENTAQRSDFTLLYRGELDIFSYYLVAENREKQIDFFLRNSEGDSRCEIDNSGISMAHSSFCANVEGQIDAGAKRAKSHQHSRCLTIGKPKTVHVVPILRIYENDVEAGHGLSTGTVDENILYYMKTRGLSRQEALFLLVRAYLLPNLQQFKEYEGAKELLEVIEKKVDSLCSI